MLEQGVNKLRNLFPGFRDIREGVTLRRLGCSNSENPIHIGTPPYRCVNRWMNERHATIPTNLTRFSFVLQRGV